MLPSRPTKLTAIGETSAELLEAVGRRELLWLEKFGQPQYRQNPLYRAAFEHEKVHPGPQAKLLRDYLEIARFLVPDVEEMNRPIIRHPDLAPGNIFVSDTGEITSLIDWQHCAVLPLVLHTLIPTHFRSRDGQLPEFPHDFESLSDEDKAGQRRINRTRENYFFYSLPMLKLNPHFRRAIDFDARSTRNNLYAAVCSPWKGDNAFLKGRMIDVISRWSEMRSQEAPADCPIQYPEKEVEECWKEVDVQIIWEQAWEDLLDGVGVSPEGYVDNEGYDQVKKNVDKARAGWVAEMTEAQEKVWGDIFPLQSREELD